MSDTNERELFDDLEAVLSAHGADAALGWLAEALKNQQKYHQFFDVRLMQARRRLQLPLSSPNTLDQLQEPARTKLEDAYVEACREVGGLFLTEGRLREAWMYLRVAGENKRVADYLAQLEPSPENVEEIVQVALHEGVDPALGYRLVLSHFGTCNAITMFDSIAHAQPMPLRQALAALLVTHVHRELLTSLRADIERREGTPPAESATIAELVAPRPELFADLNYHLDASHLAATVRVARLIEDRDVLRLAVELTEYGRRLDKTYQYASEPPFRDLYPTSSLFFRSQLGVDVQEALDYFRQQAEEARAQSGEVAAAEIYIALLARLGRYREAIEACGALLPPGSSSGFAPSVMELAVAGREHRRAATLYRKFQDVVNYAAARIQDEAPA